jgi:hypothetical protein
VTKVHVPAGTKIRVGNAGTILSKGNDWSRRGAMKNNILDEYRHILKDKITTGKIFFFG